MSNPWNLPPRQAEILDLLTGMSNGTNKHIARELGIDHRTVEEHIRRAQNRMNTESRVQAALAWDRWRRGSE